MTVLMVAALYAGCLALATLYGAVTAPWGLFGSDQARYPGNALRMPLTTTLIALVNVAGAVALLLRKNYARHVLLASMPWLFLACTADTRQRGMAVLQDAARCCRKLLIDALAGATLR